ncbi:MAG: hypothetical protein GX456_14735 [Verrucomicrobia bacterium]|nr:hypothetical protein [Verrucomicrobiota bacterium]
MAKRLSYLDRYSGTFQRPSQTLKLLAAGPKISPGRGNGGIRGGMAGKISGLDDVRA